MKEEGRRVEPDYVGLWGTEAVEASGNWGSKGPGAKKGEVSLGERRRKEG